MGRSAAAHDWSALPLEKMAKRLPDRYADRDFFLADIVGASVKDDIHSMEHPLFSLAKGKDTKVRHYEHNGNSIEIKPGSDGMPTIWDKDIIIFLCSQMLEALNRKRPDARERVVHFRAYDYFVATNREASGASYDRLQAGLDRLASCRIKTNIVTGALVSARAVLFGLEEEAESSLLTHLSGWGMDARAARSKADLMTVIEDGQETEEGLIDVMICDQFVDGAALDVVLKQYPQIKVLMASTSDSAPRGVNVIRKPVRPADLRKRLIELLDLPNTPQAVIKENFGIIDRWKIIERSQDDSRMVAIEIEMSKWLYNAVQSKEVLTINRDYFRLSGGLERRLYELARKHCGHQPEWSVSIDTLHKKAGSSGNIRDFRRMIKAIVAGNELPEYLIHYDDERQLVTVTNRKRINESATRKLKVLG